jgi:streptomycin 6-kinase
VDVDLDVDRLVRRFGPEVSDWCAAAPTLAAHLADRWGLVLGEPLAAQGASSVALRCEWVGGVPAVLKLTPDRLLMAEEVAMLRLFASSGRVPDVFAADPAAGAVVLEEITPGTMADEMAATPSPQQWAELLDALHEVDPPVDLARNLRGRAEESFVRVGRRLAEPTIAARIDHAAWDQAIQRCEVLLDTQSRRVLLHGDLHLGNVLDGGSRGLVAIDPKACLGDPCFDAVDYVLAGAGREGVETRCALVAAASGLDAYRLHAWCQVVAPFAAIAQLTNGGTEPAVAELLSLTR